MEPKIIQERQIENSNIPIIVDLDGTLIKTDSLFELMIQAIKKNPIYLLYIIYFAVQGPAILKEKINYYASIRVELLPFRKDLIEYLRAESSKGRKIILATGAHKKIANAIIKHLEFFDGVIATDGMVNNTGEKKLEALRLMGIHVYTYAGDSWIDMPLWKSAYSGILAGVGKKLFQSVEKVTVIEKVFENNSKKTNWLKAIRVHQWLKNLLVFIPLFTAFAFYDFFKLVHVLVAFFAFSLCASATYIFNDILDLENDRLHNKKRFRPFASGEISIKNGIVVSFFMLAASFFIAFKLSNTFMMVLGAYLLLSVSYTYFLKSRIILDVIILAILYTIRIGAGAVAADIKISRWLLAFSLFSFLSLASVKRCAELMSKSGGSENSLLPGRGYRGNDLIVMYPFGIGASLAAIIVYCLFVNSPETVIAYGNNNMLWFAAVGFIYLFMRLWIQTGRGEMHDDPVVHLVEDRGSLCSVFVILAIMSVAYLSGRN